MDTLQWGIPRDSAHVSTMRDFDGNAVALDETLSIAPGPYTLRVSGDGGRSIVVASDATVCANGVRVEGRLDEAGLTPGELSCA